jgi:hypothetical protein
MLDLHPQQVMGMQPLARCPPDLAGHLGVSDPSELGDTRQRTLKTGRNSQSSNALPASPDTPEPRPIVREIVAVSAKAVLHRFRLFRDVRGRVQRDEVVTLDAARLQPHVRDRL